MIPASRKIVFTRHAQHKMAFYRLSEQRVRSVLHAPLRVEEGIAPKTIAVMKPASLRMQPHEVPAHRHGSRSQSWSQEIWVMVQDIKGQRTVISAWRYPGVTKPRGEIAQQMIRGEYASFRGVVR